MRPEGQEKLGYFPTPPKTLQHILQMLAAPAGTTPQLLDPCAGEGRAIAAVAHHLNGIEAKPHTWAIEVDYGRSNKIANNFPDIELIHSPFQETVRSHNAWSLIWFNPPFDFTRIKSTDDSTGDDAEREHKRNSRTEHEFAKDLLPNLAVGGIWVSLIPMKVATEPHVIRWHLANLKNLSVYKFPADEFEAYGQLLIVGVRQPHRRINVEADADLIALATERFSKPPDLAEAAAEGPLPVYTLPGLPPPPIFRRKKLDDEELLNFYATTLQANAHADPAIITRTRPRAGAGFTPVIPLRPGHIASIVASGELGVLPVADYSKLLKGRATRKGIGHDKHGLIVDETASEAERIVESFETQIVTLDRDGHLVVNDTLGAFERVMEEHAQEIAAYVARMFAPLYTEKDERNWEVMTPLLQTKGLYHRSERGLLPTQKAIVDAGVKCLRTHKHVLYVAEMGSGKSAIALATIECMNSYPAVVLCPAHLVEKWVREVKDTIPGANPMILKSASDIATFAEMFQHPAAKGVAIISKEKAKLGPGWKPDPMFSTAPAKWQEYDRKTGHTRWVKRTWRVARCPKCGVMLEGLDLKKSKPNRCPNKVNEKGKDGTYRQRTCGEALYTFGTPGVQHRHLPNRLAHAGIWRSPSRTLVTLPPPDAEEPKQALHRWPLADLLVRQVQIGTLVADEVHQYKGKGTDQGRAFHILAAAAKYNIALTGTIFGGKAPDLFYLLYRLSSDFRRQFPYGGESLFTDLYGRREIHLAPEETDRYGRTTGKKRRVAAVRAIPGISPAIYAHTLKTMIITSLKDLHIPLPPYSEKIIRLEMTEWQRRQYDWVDGVLYNHIKRGFSSFDSQMMREAAALMSVYLQTTLSRPNSGFRTEEVWWKPKPDKEHVPYWVGRHASPIPFHMQGIDITEGAATFVTADDLNLGDEAHEDLDGDEEETNGAHGTKTNTTRKARPTDRTHPKTPPGMETMTLHPAAPFEELLPKEQALIDLIREEIAERRKVLVYVRQTGTRDIQPRLAHILKNAGIRASVLGAVEPTKREAWIDAQLATGAQVIITNPRKVETGLDLIQFQSLVFYELDYSLFTIWQAMRRVWRIGQTKPVRTYFLVYKNTMEDRALTIMGSKVKAAKTLYGDTTASALADQGETSDLMAELARQILSGAPPASDGINSIFADDAAEAAAAAAEWSEDEPTPQEDTPMPDPQDNAITLDPGDYRVATPAPETAASPPPKKTLDLADIEFFSGLLDRRDLFCMGGNDYGFPDFRDFGDIPGGDVRHVGYGLFEFKSNDKTRVFTWDAGGSMNQTPNGTHFSYIRVEKGEPPVTAEQLRAVLQRHIEARAANAARQQEVADAEAKSRAKAAAQAAQPARWRITRMPEPAPKPDRRKVSTIDIMPGEVLRIGAEPYEVLYVSNYDPRRPDYYEVHLRRQATDAVHVYTLTGLKNALDVTAHAYTARPGFLIDYNPMDAIAALAAQETAAQVPEPQPEPEPEDDSFDDEEEDGEEEYSEFDDLPDDYDYDLEANPPEDDEDEEQQELKVGDRFQHADTIWTVTAINAAPPGADEIRDTIEIEAVTGGLRVPDRLSRYAFREIYGRDFMHFDPLPQAEPEPTHEEQPVSPGPLTADEYEAAEAAADTRKANERLATWLNEWRRTLAVAKPDPYHPHLAALDEWTINHADSIDMLFEARHIFNEAGNAVATLTTAMLTNNLIAARLKTLLYPENGAAAEFKLGDLVHFDHEDDDLDEPWLISKIAGDDDEHPDNDLITLERGIGYDYESVTYFRRELREEFGINVTDIRASVDKPIADVYAGEDFALPLRNTINMRPGITTERYLFCHIDADGHAHVTPYDVNGHTIDSVIQLPMPLAELEDRFGIRLIDAPRPGTKQPEPEPVNIAARPAPFDINTTNLYELRYERDRVRTHLNSGENRLALKINGIGERLTPERLAATERSVANERARLAQLEARIAEVEAAQQPQPQPEPEPVATEPPAPETHVYKGEILQWTSATGKLSRPRIFNGFDKYGQVKLTDAEDPEDTMVYTMNRDQFLDAHGIALHDEPRPAPEPEPEPPPDPFAEVRWLIDLAIKQHNDAGGIDALTALIDDGGAMSDWWNDLVFEQRQQNLLVLPLKSGQIRTALREARNLMVANTINKQKIEGTRLTFNSLKSWVAAWRAIEQRPDGNSAKYEAEDATLAALTEDLINASTDRGLLGQLSAILKDRKRTHSALANPRLQELHVVAQNRLQQLATPPQPPRPPAQPQPGRTVDEMQHDRVKADLATAGEPASAQPATDADAELAAWFAAWNALAAQPDSTDKRGQQSQLLHDGIDKTVERCSDETLMATVAKTLDDITDKRLRALSGVLLLTLNLRIGSLALANANDGSAPAATPPPADPFDGLAFYAPPLPTKRNAVRDQMQRLVLDRLREIKYGELAKAIDWASKWNATPQARQKYLLEHIMRKWTQVPGMNNPGDEDVQVVFAHLIRHWKQIKALSAADAWTATHTRAQGAAVVLRKQIKEDYEADLRGGISILPAFHTQLDAYIQTLAALHEIRQAMTRRRIQPPHLPLRHTQTADSLTAAKYPAWATGALFFGAEEHDDYAAITAWRNSDDFQRVHALRGVPVPQLTATLRKHHAETYPPPAEPKPDKPPRAQSFAEAWAAKQGLSLKQAKDLADGAPATASAFLEPGDD